eukprot:4706458-Alexandrium_andersonii.AAC.1
MAAASVTARPMARCGSARAVRPPRPPPQPPSGLPPCAPLPGQAPSFRAVSRLGGGSSKAEVRALRG